MLLEHWCRILHQHQTASCNLNWHIQNKPSHQLHRNQISLPIPDMRLWCNSVLFNLTEFYDWLGQSPRYVQLSSTTVFHWSSYLLLRGNLLLMYDTWAKCVKLFA